MGNTLNQPKSLLPLGLPDVTKIDYIGMHTGPGAQTPYRKAFGLRPESFIEGSA
jgi:hypothetical protein